MSASRFVALFATLSVTACVQTVHAPLVVTTLHPSAPAVEASGAFTVGEQAVLIVSPPTLMALAGAQVVGVDANGAPVYGAVDTAGYDLVTSGFESALLRAGARPVSQAALAQALQDPQLQAAIQAVPAEGDTALVQQSILLGRATQAPLVLLIRSVQLGYAQDPVARLASVVEGCNEWRVRAAELGIDAALVRVENAEVLWTGRTTVRATDLLPEPVTLAAGPGHTEYERDYGPIRVVATGDTQNICEGSDIPGYTCWEVGTNDCSAGEGQGARPISPQALQTLADRAVAELAGAAVPAAQATAGGEAAAP